jgi:hypothetical protein
MEKWTDFAGWGLGLRAPIKQPFKKEYRKGSL